MFLIRSEILGLLFNTLTAKYELSRRNRENLPLPIQTKLPKKRKSPCCIFFDCFLTRWLRTMSYLVAIETIYSCQLKSNYLKNENLFAAFFFTFRYPHQISNVLKKMSLIRQIFLELLTSKSGWPKSITGLVSENLLELNVVPRPQNSWNLQKSTFVQLFHHSDPNWVSKSYF